MKIVKVEELQKCETVVGYLIKGDVFTFDGRKYRVNKLIEKTNGYVSCIDIECGKSKRFHIDTDVEILERIEMNETNN